MSILEVREGASAFVKEKLPALSSSAGSRSGRGRLDLVEQSRFQTREWVGHGIEQYAEKGRCSLPQLRGHKSTEHSVQGEIHR